MVDPPPSRHSAAKALKYEDKDSLTASLSELLRAPQFSDLTLVVGEKAFPVHRNILAARSSVFKTMLSTDCRESVSGKVEIADIRPAVVGLLLRYVLQCCRKSYTVRNML